MCWENASARQLEDFEKSFPAGIWRLWVRKTNWWEEGNDSRETERPASSTSQSGVWNHWNLLISKHECAVCERQDCKGDLSYVTKDPGSEGHSAGQPTPVAPLWMCCRPTVGPTVDPSLFSVGTVGRIRTPQHRPQMCSGRCLVISNTMHAEHCTNFL